MTEAFSSQLASYKRLLDLWKIDAENFNTKKKLTSCFRRIIGMGVATGGVWTGNIRALRHVLAMRCSEAAEEEICHVFTRIADMMIRDLPSLFGDFKPDPRGFFKPKYPKV
jgi:thymidylate synthase (FAD)